MIWLKLKNNNQNRKINNKDYIQKKEKNFYLKDKIYTKSKIEIIANNIKKNYEDFNKEEFLLFIENNIDKLELMQRNDLLSLAYYQFLPKNYNKSIFILLYSLPKITQKEDFIYASYSAYIQKYGLEKENLNLSFEILSIFTNYFSSEYAIRDFINIYPNETLNFLENLSIYGNYKQKRLVSEGLRPNLPWGKKINLDYKKTIKFLDNIYYTNDRYVTKSIANHLNDISKIDKKLVFETLKKWENEKKQEEKEFEFIKKHSLRTLIKKNDKISFNFLGYNLDPKIEISNFFMEKKQIKVNEELFFSFIIKNISNQKEKILIQYIFENIELKTRKIFILKKLLLEKDQEILISKKHLIKPLTTKKIHYGEYKLSIKINTKIYILEKFNLIGLN